MKRLTTDEFITQARQVHGDKYDYSKTVYTSAISKATITCLTHGDFAQRPNDHTSGKNGCPKCKADSIRNSKRSNPDMLERRFNTVHGSKYSYAMDTFHNQRTKMRISCPIHGNFLMSPEKHLNGHGCHKCVGSSGEKLTAYVLDTLGIKYETEKTFNDLNDKSALRFDFFLPELNALIEYDGQQHTEVDKIFKHSITTDDGAIERFTRTLYLDVLKNIYATTNKMYLLRISILPEQPMK